MTGMKWRSWCIATLLSTHLRFMSSFKMPFLVYVLLLLHKFLAKLEKSVDICVCILCFLYVLCIEQYLFHFSFVFFFFFPSNFIRYLNLIAPKSRDKQCEIRYLVLFEFVFLVVDIFVKNMKQRLAVPLYISISVLLIIPRDC